ncbi:DUF3137 domain-containing protein [Hydrogenimonas sp.]
MNLSRSALLDYYYDELYPELVELEAERRKILKWAAALALIVALPAIWLSLQTLKIGSETPLWIAAAAAGIFGFGVNWLMLSYRRRFKRRIFSKIVTKIDPSLLYLPTGTIDRTLFTVSGLFGDRIDHFSGRDLIRGEIGKTPIAFSSVKAEREYRDARGREHRRVVFAGTFIVTEFHKSFSHTTLVVPDLAEKYLGVFGGWLQTFSGKKVVRLDHPGFEKEFVVYADDPVEAHYILTPIIMEKILALRHRTGSNLYLSFRLNKLFIAIENGGDWFEPSLFRSLLRFDVFRGYIENLNQILSIVEELNLNRRIWSKE